ncbi:MAG: response regulator transcription factor [Lachnospiraceae bacterium]|nr:response regulator transcription factor [Lachnospiraceae bacterium]
MKFDCLIIDDEKVLADNTNEYFNMFDVKTKAVYSAAEAWEFFEGNDASLILLDINLGDGSGFEFCKKLRETKDIPILFISARNTDDDKIIALNIGGDDYIEKPYSLGVLLAKVRVVLKRYAAMENADNTAAENTNDGGKAGRNEHNRNRSDDNSYVAGNDKNPSSFADGALLVDHINKRVYMNGVEKKLTSLEYMLLKYLTDNPDRLITKQELFDNVWNDKFTSDGTLNVHIRKLREAIEEDPGEPKRIITVWKEGYRYEKRK